MNSRWDQKRFAAKAGEMSVKKFVKTDDLFNIHPDEWIDIGRDMLGSAANIPVPFGDRIRDFTEHCHHLKAAEWKIFIHLRAPIYMNHRLPDKDYKELVNHINGLAPVP